VDALFDLLIRYLVHSKFPRDNTTRNHFEPNKAIVDPIYTDADVIRGCNLISNGGLQQLRAMTRSLYSLGRRGQAGQAFNMIKQSAFHLDECRYYYSILCCRDAIFIPFHLAAYA
jgi:hypothetical protein